MRNIGSESGFSPEIKQPSKYEILANPETRERLKERMLRFTQAVHDRHIESLVFLDRSARPLSWMFQDLWSAEFPEEKRPDIKFVNFGTTSHVQKGISHLLETVYWGSYEQGTAGSTTDKTRVPLMEAEAADTWITTDQIPREWQQSMLKKLELSEELKSIFKKEFQDKSVLIVDDMGASGKSQMAALGFFSLAFPEAKQFESTSLFYSRSFHDADASEDEDVDMQFIPWLQELGMAGILELSDDALLSGAMTEENIKRILPILEKEIARKQAPSEFWMEYFSDAQSTEALQRDLDRKYLYEHPEELFARARQLRKELKDLAKEAIESQKQKHP